MEQLFIPGSIIADYFYLGLFLLVAASLIAGYVDAIAGGAGLILIPAFLMVGLPPQVALAQEKLVSTIGTVAAIKNFMKSSSIVWRIVPVGIVAALIGAFVGAKVILILPVETINYIILAFLPIGLLATLFKGVLLKKDDGRGEIKKSAVAVFLTCLIVGFYDGFSDRARAAFSSSLCLSSTNCRCCRLRLLPRFSILLPISGHSSLS